MPSFNSPQEFFGSFDASAPVFLPSKRVVTFNEARNSVVYTFPSTCYDRGYSRSTDSIEKTLSSTNLAFMCI